MNFIIYYVLSIATAFATHCNKLHVSTDIMLSKDNIVRAGIAAEQWSKKTETPQMVGSSTLFDFLYITLEGKELKESYLTLEYDDHFFANSSIHLEHKQANTYSLKVDYMCKQYGGALIDYSLLLDIPDCGKTRIHWKKICGNPMAKRQWLSMDIQVGKYNQTIVKNGQLLNLTYFDKDLDNDVFTVPPSVNYTVFYLYMDLPDGRKSDDRNESREFFQAVEKERETEDPASDEFQVLEAILKMIPEVEISQPVVDADHIFLHPQLSGDLATGGLVTDEVSTLIVEYNCITTGDTQIELNIPLEYFKDIAMVFVKQCAIVNHKSSVMGSLFVTVFLAVAVFLGYTIYTKKISLQQLQSLVNKRFQPVKREEDYEQEFRVGHIEHGKYGSI